MDRRDLKARLLAVVEEAHAASMSATDIAEEFLTVGFEAVIITERTDILITRVEAYLDTLRKLQGAQKAIDDFIAGTGGGKA